MFSQPMLVQPWQQYQSIACRRSIESFLRRFSRPDSVLSSMDGCGWQEQQNGEQSACKSPNETVSKGKENVHHYIRVVHCIFDGGQSVLFLYDALLNAASEEIQPMFTTGLRISDQLCLIGVS